MNLRFTQGMGLIEVVVAVAIFTALLLSMFSVHGVYVNLMENTAHNAKVSLLLEEGLEVARYLRDSDWTPTGLNVPLDTPLYVTFDGVDWNVSTIQTLEEGIYDRTLTLAEVRRDSSDDIVESGGTVDDTTRKVTVSVTWEERETMKERTVETYLGSMFE